MAALGFGWADWAYHTLDIRDVTIRYPAEEGENRPIQLPYTGKSPEVGRDFVVKLTLDHHAWQSGIVKFAPDDCVKMVRLNGKEITHLFHPERCWPMAQTINLKPYLVKGENHLTFRIFDKDIDHGMKLFGRPPYSQMLLVALSLALALALLPELGWHRRMGGWQALRRFQGWAWRVSLVPLLGFCIMAIAEWPRFGWELSPLRVELVPVLVAFLLWLRNHQPLTLQARRLPWVLALVGFTIGSWCFGKNMQALRLFCIWGGMGCSLFVFVRPRQCWALAKSDLRMAGVIGFTAATGLLFHFMSEHLWGRMAYTTTIFLRSVLQFFGFHSEIQGNSNETLSIVTDAFQLEIHEPCSGLEGIFMFLFLLSILLLLDWRVFGRFRLWPLYVGGYIYMFLMNALRIGVLFMIGDWAWRRDASEWAQHFRQAPVIVFHSYGGWLIYLAAFMLFAVWMYRRARRLLIDEACGRHYE